MFKRTSTIHWTFTLLHLKLQFSCNYKPYLFKNWTEKRINGLLHLICCELCGCCHVTEILIDVTLWAKHRKLEVASKVTNSATRVICKVCCEVRHDTFSELQSAAETGRGGRKTSDSVKWPAPLGFACVSGCVAGSKLCWLGLCVFFLLISLNLQIYFMKPRNFFFRKHKLTMDHVYKIYINLSLLPCQNMWSLWS